MCVSEELLERTEEIFDLIPCAEDDTDLNSAMDALRCFLERDVDGWTQHSQVDLARAVQSRLEEIWDLIPSEIKSDADLKESFQDFTDSLEELAWPEEQESTRGYDI